MVEVSSDGGWAWYKVALEDMSEKHKWTWRTWKTKVPCDQEGWTVLVVRCWDNAINTQPTEVRQAWNWGLHVTSSCHRIKIYSVNATRPATRRRLQEFEERKESFLPITRPAGYGPQSMEDYNKNRGEPRDVDD
jgi:sulfite oxidase